MSSFPALRIFLNADSRISNSLLRKFLAQLRSIQKWMQSQTVYRFYSSSLLLAYDAKLLNTHNNQRNLINESYAKPSTHTDSTNSNNNLHNSYNLTNTSTNNLQCSDDMEWAVVKMIDFAHVFQGENGSVDSNYLFGIHNLVRLFEEFLET